MIGKIEHFLLTRVKPTVYDAESMTVIELVNRLLVKTNECVEAFNEFETYINTHVGEYESGLSETLENFKVGIRQEFQDFIDVVEVKIQDHETKVDEMKNALLEYDEVNERLILGTDEGSEG